MISVRRRELDATAIQRSLAVRVGMVAWPSFFAAAIASVVFFAMVDPLELAQNTWPHVIVSREVGYSVGFFMFWACTLSSSAFTALLLAAPRCMRDGSNELDET